MGSQLQRSSPFTRLQKDLPFAGALAAVQAASISFLGPFIYMFFFRSQLWDWSYSFTSMFFSLPKNYGHSSFPGWADITFRLFVHSLLLSFLWQFAHATFSIFVSQPPLKKNTPLTNGAKDPNGALLLGLRAKKPLTRSFAFYELLSIAQSFPDRRASLYLDIDRTPGPSILQIKDACLAELAALRTRTAPSAPAPSNTAPPTQDLPHIARPVRTDDIFAAPATAPASRAQRAVQDLASFARSQGQSPASMRPSTRKLLDAGAARVPQGRATVDGYLSAALRSPIAGLVRHTLRRRVEVAALGTPRGRAFSMQCAAAALARLVVAGLKEDRYGKVAPCVPEIVRGYVGAITGVEALVKTMPPHWTDVEPVDERQRALVLREGEVGRTLAVLRESLKEVLIAYGEYATGLGLTVSELREAKEIATRGKAQGDQRVQRPPMPPMQEVR